jgi:hypothetical protein
VIEKAAGIIPEAFLPSPLWVSGVTRFIRITRVIPQELADGLSRINFSMEVAKTFQDLLSARTINYIRHDGKFYYWSLTYAVSESRACGLAGVLLSKNIE